MSASPRLVCCAGLLFLLVNLAQAATHNVTLQGLSFTPSSLTIQVGDTVRWTNQGGFHDVVASNESFTSGPPSSSAFTFEHTFTTAGTFGYYCSVHGAPGVGMAGTIIVQAATPPVPTINRAIDGSWFNPATDGQGFLVEVFPPSNIFTFAWFTWTDSGGYDWMTGNGTYTGNVATLEIVRSSGGRFNDPAPVTNTANGTATFTLTDCTHATFQFNILNPARSGSINLQRILPAGAECVVPTAGQAERAQ